MKSYLARLYHDTRGSVTVEFVIIFPAVIMLILFIIYASSLIATVSDVQQLAYELARSAIPVNARMTSPGDICAVLNNDYLQSLIAHSVMLKPSTVSQIPACPIDANGQITVRVTVDLLGNGVASVASDLGIKLGTITRTATIRL